MYTWGNCRLWSPANDGRALLVPTGDGDNVGYFAFRPGKRLNLVGAPVPGDLDPGFRRADARMRRLLASNALCDINREGFMHVVRNEVEEIYATTTRLAA